MGRPALKSLYLYVILACVLSPALALADGNNYGAAVYLQQGVGAQANGMGDAFVAVADDATSGYWNPAGLAQMGIYLYEVGAQYAFLPNDMSASFLSYAFQIPDVGGFSLGWINYGIGNIEGRDAAGLVTTSFGSSENAVIVSYGRRVYELLKGLIVGANLKLLHQGIGDHSAMGHGFDVGLYWKPWLEWDHSLGLNVQNLMQKLYWADSVADTSLVNAKLGLALRFLPSEDVLYYHHLITAVDLDLSEYGRFKFHAGAEYWFIDNMAARAGFNGSGVTAGASYRAENYQVDYAFIFDTSELASHQHRVSLELRLAGNYDQPVRLPAAEMVANPAPEGTQSREEGVLSVRPAAEPDPTLEPGQD